MSEEPTLSIFTTAKAFTGLHAVIQANALRSWAELSPRPEIVLIGDEDGYGDAATAVGAKRITDLGRNEFGTPLMSDIFDKGRDNSTGDVVMFINADIVLPPRFTAAVAAVAARFPKFLLVGRRIDLDLTTLIEFGPRWWDSLERDVSARGSGRGDLAIDYFCFSRDLYGEIPQFAIGRTRYDNWLIWEAAARGGVVVDASPFTQVIHQNHDYGQQGGMLRAWEGPEARRAEELLGHWSHYHSIGHATSVVSPSGEVAPAKGWRYSSARPRRVVAHALRATRPLRRRAKVLAANISRRGRDGPPNAGAPRGA